MIQFWRQPSAHICFAILGLLLAIDLALLPGSNVRISVEGYLAAAGALVVCGVAALVSWRDATTAIPPGHAVPVNIKMARGLQQYAVLTAILFAFTMCGALCSYLVITLGMPFQDEAFSAIDKALGLDWFALLRWANSNDVLSVVLTVSYSSCLPQVVVVLTLLTFSGRFDAAWDFLALLLLGGLVTILVSGLVPALAPFGYYKPDPSLYDRLQAVGANGQIYLPDLRALHAGTFQEFSLAKAQGIIAFPSYHTVMGALFIYAMRDIRAVFWPALALNVTMIVATIPVGGHYFADVLAGLLVTLGSIVAVDAANRRPPFWVRLMDHMTLPPQDRPVTEATAKAT